MFGIKYQILYLFQKPRKARAFWSMILFGLFLSYPIVFSQSYGINGMVVDEITGEPIPFTNISVKNTTKGCVSGMEGDFYLDKVYINDSIVFTSVGYRPKVLPADSLAEKWIRIELEVAPYDLEEVVITPGENPAFAILRKIKERKDINNPANFKSYSYESYNKFRLDLNNFGEKLQDRRFLKQFQFIFDYVDSSEVFGKKYLPILISESITEYYYQESPTVKKEVVKAFKMSGIENNTISQFSGKMYQQLNIYDNFITLFDPGFVSPIADFGRAYYNYKLEDSSYIDNEWCYKISYTPKRKNERLFYGYIWVVDSIFAVKKAQIRVSKDVNLNFINDLIAVNDYAKINDSTYFLVKEEILIDFNLTKSTSGLFGHKTSHYRNIKLDSEMPEEVIEKRTDTYVDEDSVSKSEEYWESNRPEELTKKDADVYTMVDSVKNVPAFKSAERLIDMLVNYYYDFGYFEYGPYYTTFSNNPIEGSRFRIGGRTTKRLNEKFRVGGHLAYGLKDNEFKYGANIDVLAKKKPRRFITAKYLHDIKQLGKSENALLEDNFLTAFLRRNENYKLTMLDQYSIAYEHEWYQGFTNTFSFERTQVYASDSVPFVLPTDQALPHLSTNVLSLNIHYSYREKFLLGHFSRISLGSKYPTIDLKVSIAPDNFLDNQYEYYRLKLTISDKMEVNPFGYIRYIAEAGKVFGKAPYPFLALHDGNETYVSDPYAYNMMNYYEFVSDEYASISIEHHLQGFFLNMIPLVRRLKLREVVNAKFLVGSLNDPNREVMKLPYGLNELTEPYYEAGVGVENIFKFFRLDAMWRLAYNNNPDIQNFGLRLTMVFTF